MKALVAFGFAVLLAVAGFAAEPGFLKQLPPEKFRRAGLEKLTADELRELETLFAEHQRGELKAVEQRAEAKVAAAEAKVKEAETKAAAVPADEKKGPSWIKALITLQQASEKPDKLDAVQTRIAGTFKGWSGHTTFALENGQVWQQTDGSSRVDRAREAPEVKIYPGMLGVYWMEVQGINQRVKVKPIRLE